MKKLTQFPTEELAQENQLYISIGMELHVDNITSDKDRIQLSNLLSEAEKELEQLTDDKIIEGFKEQLKAVEQHERELTMHSGTLAIFITPQDFYYYHLVVPTTDYVTLSDAPNRVSLIENYQFTNEYHLLVLGREEMRLYYGTQSGITEIKIDDEDAPLTLEDALGTEREGGELSHGTYGGQGAGGRGVQSFHGHNETSAQKDIDRDNYFRLVDNYIYDNYSVKTELPLILYTTPDNQSVFREITKNQYLLDSGIEKSGVSANENEIEKLAIAKNVEIIKQEQYEMIEKFRETSPEYRISNIPSELAAAAVQGRIETLLIDKAHDLRGSISSDGSYIEDDSHFAKPLVNYVLQNNGEIYVLPSDEMPVGIDVAARLRY